VGLPTALPMQPLPIESAAEDGAVAELLARGGFPEPLLSGSVRTHRRWQRQRLERFVREDVRDVESVRDLSQMELLADVLPARVGSPLSLNSLREDLEVSHGTVSRWVEIFDRLYYVYRVPPYATRAIRGLKKEQKVYLWEWSQVEDPGARFENLVASHLLKLVQYLVDAEGYRARLHYVRDRDKREVDFLVCVGNKPWFLVEAKLSETSPAPALRYFGDRLGVSLRYQVVRDGGRDFVRDGVHVVPAGRFLRAVA
jgi:predicted AAA+ superfamily ATPase